MAAQQLGSGSFGSVAARQLPSGHVVAVKKAQKPTDPSHFGNAPHRSGPLSLV